jgi:hypothetical protein
MFFDVLPSQIEALDSKELVKLLRRLLHAEALKAGISLRGVSVPLQITVSDGGEDARIAWDGGLEKTDYLPCRFSVFQSKATDPGTTGWMKEVWARSARKKGASRKLNEAVARAIAQRGAYIGFTSDTLVGGRYDDHLQAIIDGIIQAGANPNDLTTIDIYDANKIAGWASRHPAVSVWLNERQSGLTLRGFQSIDEWGKRADLASIRYVGDNAARYLLGGRDLTGQDERQSVEKDTLTFQQAKERILDHLSQARSCVRLIGPSGIGKTRSVYEMFTDTSTIAKSVSAISVIYCDYRTVGQQLLQVVSALAEVGTPSLVVADECPREVAHQLASMVNSAESELRLLTIDIDDRPIEATNCISISVAPGDDALIDGIIRQRLPKADDSDISYIKNLCGGFPRIAVLATDSYARGAPVLKSIEDVVDRILAGCGIGTRDQVRAIECLALFDRLGADEDLSEQFDFVAETLAGLNGNEMYEHIARASQHHLVDRRGRYFVAQPLPIAAFLGARRLDALRVKTLVSFVEAAPPDLLGLFFQQWRHFDVSRTAPVVAERLLATHGMFGSLDALNTEFGSRCFDALVHVAPDTAAETITRVFGELSVDELGEVREGRRYLVAALEKLVFRNGSFAIAARLLMRLAATENEEWGNNSSSWFKQLFQLQLSGTEASPTDRFAILDEGLSSGDNRVVAVCVDALDSAFEAPPFHAIRWCRTDRQSAAIERLACEDMGGSV